MTSARCTTSRCLLGFGASAVCPYLAYESIDALIEEGELTGLSAFEARYQYGKALNKGIVKTMSKMGVSTVASYVGSQLFEAVGISDTVLSAYFPGFHSRIGGITLEHIAAQRAHTARQRLRPSARRTGGAAQ